MWPIKAKTVEVFVRCYGQRRENGGYRSKARWRKARVLWVGSLGNSCGASVELLRTPLYQQRGQQWVDRAFIRPVSVSVAPSKTRRRVSA